MSSPTYSMKTFGCKVNTYDSSLIQKQLKDFHFCSSKNTPRYHIVNTCAVTEMAVLESLRWIRRYKKQHPKTTVVVTGCGSQVQLDYYSKTREVDLIIANSHKNKLSEILEDHRDKKNIQRVFHSNIFKAQVQGEGGQVEASRSRFFLKIQDGCSQFCTFCVIPFARGKSRSLSTKHLVQEIQKAHAHGVLEVVLTGVHIGDYQDPETHCGLSGLVSEVLNKTQIPRVRLSSLEPIELTDDLISLYDNPRLCQHFHLSIQSAATKVLKQMKRKYIREDIQKCLDKIYLKYPSAFVGMDLIAGFPGETQQDFEDTYQLFKDSFWTKMHVFPYSPRPNTYALRREDHLPSPVISKRALMLRNLSQERYKEQALSQIGKVKQVLPLKKGGALSRDYWTVEWDEKHLSAADSPKPEEQTTFDSSLREKTVQLIQWNNTTHKFKSMPTTVAYSQALRTDKEATHDRLI